MRRRQVTIGAVLAALCLAAFAPAAEAQQYRFQVPEVRVVLTVQPDASVLIDYTFTFQNQRGAHAIDIVDVGMTTKQYTVLEASVEGQPLSVWKPSTEIAIGPEVHLEPWAIPPGGRGVFTCRARVTDMVFEDRKSADRASLRFTPTWFGERYVGGETDLLLVVKFPPGVDAEDVVWHSDERPFFQKGILDPDGVAFVSWSERYRFTGPMMFGCSFPRAAMDRVVESSLGREFLVWWVNSQRAQTISAIAFLVLFGTFYLLITRGTGITFLVIGAVIFFIIVLKSPLIHLGMWPAVPLLGAVWYWGMHARRPRYMPALARLESGRVCRALNAPEAAVLMDVPLHRVLGMVVTDLLDKGVVRVTGDDPPRAEPIGTRAVANVVELPDRRKVALEPYEVGFMDVLSRPPQDVQDKDFSEPLQRLVGLVRYKMSGFDPEATREYHRRVTERAWEKVEALQNPESKDALARRHFNRLRMADDYEDRMEEQRTRGWHYMPHWHHHFGRRNWERAMDRWTRPAANRAAQAIIEPVKGLDLSGVDRFTLDTLGEIARAAAKGGSGGGGGGCACAGCACACACAGGGR